MTKDVLLTISGLQFAAQGEEEAEPVEHLCGKCEAYACEWKETADQLWKEHPHQHTGYTNYKKRTEN